MSKVRLAVAALALSASASHGILASEATEVSGVAAVVSGDVLEIADRRFRLFGSDAPELGQRCALKSRLYDCGEIARSALMDLTAGVRVTCTPLSPEGEETLARCVAQGYDLSEGMVYTGWALAQRDVSDRYIRFEETAKSKRHGMWRGRFIAPWDWRAGVRLPEEGKAGKP